MPTVQPPAKVLVSGASGFIAVWVIKSLLDQGYAVRGTVRSIEKGNYLKKIFEKHGDKLEIVVVKDIAEEGAFDEAVKGVDAIEHTASPFHYNVDDPQELIRPAVDGTVGILTSAKKNGDAVKRIVITSSIMAILRFEAAPVVVTEKDWGDMFVEQVEKYGREASAMAKYSASKVLAEKAAWEFYNTNKESVNWDMVIFNPPYVYGPPLHEVSSASKLNTSSLDWYETVVKRTTTAQRLGAMYIDVRDLAELHARALTTEGAEGERYIVDAGHYEWQQFLDAADGRPLTTAIFQPTNTTDTSKSERVFNFKYRTIEETTKDTIEEYKRRGWVSA